MTARMLEWLTIRYQEEALRVAMFSLAALALLWFQGTRLFPAGKQRNLATAAFTMLGILAYAILFLFALYTICIAYHLVW